MASCGLAPADVDYVEAHGTGTTLGDPIEAEALAATYGRAHRDGTPLWLGTVKSNLGHAQAAAGVAGVMKVVLSLEHGWLPRSLYSEEPSPHVEWEGSGLRLLSEGRPWPAGRRKRRAGVSSFGISGTNAHVILEEAPEAEVEKEAPPRSEPLPVPLLISGRTAAAVRAAAAQLRGHPAALRDLAWSLAISRTHFEHRAMVWGTSGLEALAAGLPAADLVVGRAEVDGRVAFVFPGQGGQWAGMARELAASRAEFREELAACAAAFKPWLDLPPVLDGEGLERVECVQPALFAVMVSLARGVAGAGGGAGGGSRVTARARSRRRTWPAH